MRRATDNISPTYRGLLQSFSISFLRIVLISVAVGTVGLSVRVVS